jgi:hypothetical protein
MKLFLKSANGFLILSAVFSLSIAKADPSLGFDRGSSRGERPGQPQGQRPDAPRPRQPQPRPEPPQPPPNYPPNYPPQGGGGVVPVYRFFANADHFLTIDQGEGFRAPGYRYEGVAFSLSRQPVGPAAGLYRCYWSRGHFVSTDPSCEGQTVESLMGFLTTQPFGRSAIAVYRCFNNANGDHLATTNVSECYNAQFIVERVLGYVIQ